MEHFSGGVTVKNSSNPLGVAYVIWPGVGIVMVINLFSHSAGH